MGDLGQEAEEAEMVSVPCLGQEVPAVRHGRIGGAHLQGGPGRLD